MLLQNRAPLRPWEQCRVLAAQSLIYSTRKCKTRSDSRCGLSVCFLYASATPTRELMLARDCVACIAWDHN